MQQTALARTGRLGLSRDALVAIYVGLRLYRLKQRTDDKSDAESLLELVRTLDGLQTIPATPADLEAAIAREAAAAVAHDRPGSGEAALLELVARIAAV